MYYDTGVMKHGTIAAVLGVIIFLVVTVPACPGKTLDYRKYQNISMYEILAKQPRFITSIEYNKFRTSVFENEDPKVVLLIRDNVTLRPPGKKNTLNAFVSGLIGFTTEMFRTREDVTNTKKLLIVFDKIADELWSQLDFYVYVVKDSNKNADRLLSDLMFAHLASRGLKDLETRFVRIEDILVSHPQLYLVGGKDNPFLDTLVVENDSFFYGGQFLDNCYLDIRQWIENNVIMPSQRPKIIYMGTGVKQLIY